METYRTAQAAAQMGLHPNTLRFYEAQGLLPPVGREKNGYRIYTPRHLYQLRLIRLAFRAEVISGNLRREAVDIVKTAAVDIDLAASKTLHYQTHIRKEMQQARQAIGLAEKIMQGESMADDTVIAGRRAAAAKIGVSVDILRDWERNGLLGACVPRGPRHYSAREMNLLQIIALLRRAHYSQMAIRRMVHRLEGGEEDLLQALDSPDPAEDVISVADRYLTSLTGALADSHSMLQHLNQMGIDQ